MFRLVPTLSFKQCLSHPKLLMSLFPLDHSFQHRARLQEPILSKTLNCYCLMRAVRSQHTKEIWTPEKISEVAITFITFWRYLHLLTSSLGIRCPRLSAGVSAVFSQLPPSSLSPAIWMLSQKQRRYLCPFPLE